MTETVDMTLRIKNQLDQALQKKDPDAQVQINRNTFGWLLLWVTTTLFETKDFTEREDLVDQILAALNLKLSQYPFADYHLWTPLEKDQLQDPPIQFPLWSEILQAPEPEKPVALAEESKRPLVVTFYSFKGGVGRSTSLAFVANIITTRGHRVVMIDFDLEAPGLSFAHPSEAPEDKTRGVLDYLYERYVIPEENTPKIEDCIRRINVPVRGELYLIPAGAYNENYVHLLADLQVRSLYQSEINPIHQLLKDVKSTLDPDIILIDARTGFTEMGAVALFDQADLGIICFSPTSQSFAGLEWVVKAAKKQRQYYGIPDLRFLLTPMPPVTHTQQQEWLGQTADWIMQHWEIPTSMTVDDLYYHVPYNSNIITLSSLFTEVPTSILDPYYPIADTIRASLPETNNLALSGSSGKIAENRSTILNELQFHSAIAQYLDTEEIPKIFQRTGDFPKFLQDRTWLVRGAKGTGKTLLFRLFIEKPEEARKLAKPHEKLDNVTFVSGHGPRTSGNTTLFTSNNLGAYEESIGSDKWKEFWEHYLLLRLAAARPDLQSFLSDPFLIEVCQQKQLTQTQIAEWLVARISSAHSSSKIYDELQTINERLKVQNEKIWVLYDDLDTGFGQKYDRRRKALEALLEWWLEIGPHLSNIAPKILLREDIWKNLNFTNKTYYGSRTIELRWEEADLWRLILRQVFQDSPTRLWELIKQQASINELEQIENAQLDVLRKGLFPLWGEQMGRSNKAFTYNWVRKRISDYKEIPFPRSLIFLLQNAVINEKTADERNPYDVVLRPRSLTDALKVVSEERVSDIRNEYTEFAEYLDKLNGERSPIDVERLKTIWEVDTAGLKELVKGMTEAGILKEYTATSRQLTPDVVRYSVADLYLSGLKMTRVGRR